MTTRREILNEHICSIGFWDIRETNDITEGDIMKVRVYITLISSLGKQLHQQ